MTTESRAQEWRPDRLAEIEDPVQELGLGIAMWVLTDPLVQCWPVSHVHKSTEHCTQSGCGRVFMLHSIGHVWSVLSWYLTSISLRYLKNEIPPNKFHIWKRKKKTTYILFTYFKQMPLVWLKQTPMITHPDFSHLAGALQVLHTSVLGVLVDAWLSLE